MKIMVVEDHPDTRELLRICLEEMGHAVVLARSMHEALIELHPADPDVLISDIGLPDGDGWELLRRAALPSSVYPVAISGYGTYADELRSLAAGFRHHLVKPIRLEKLEAILQQAAKTERGDAGEPLR